MNLTAIQSALREANLDGWLFYDHHHRDPIAYRILVLDEHSFVSRRWFYFIPAHGEPRKLVHRIESGKLDALPGSKSEYSSWQELERELAAMLAGATSVAMQYSPRNAIMYVSMVDAGTVELVRSMGKTIVSSADLVSLFEAVLTEAQIASHFEAQRRLDEVLRAGWLYIADAIHSGRSSARGSSGSAGGSSGSAGGSSGSAGGSSGIDEFSVVQFLLQGIERAGLWTDHGPNCSVGPNSADSHYEPTQESSRPIATGDFVLIDIWAKLAAASNPSEPDPTAIWYDITWTGVIGREPSDREQLVFHTVRDARDAAIATIQSAYAPPTGPAQPIAGWQADDAARNLIRAAGFGDFFTHRTGHNIALSLHGNGANLDNLETHDERLLLPNTCFSVEPGIYFPGEFGVRSEVNMITRSARGPEPAKAIVTGPAQTKLLRL